MSPAPRILLVLGLVMLLGACDWSMFGYNASGSRFSPETNVSVSNVGTFVQKWKMPLVNQYVTSPVVAGGVVYVGSASEAALGTGNSLYAFDAVSGALKWKYPTGWSIPISPVVANGVVYFGDTVGDLYAVNASTGKLVKEDLRSPSGVPGPWTTAPVFVNNVLYIGNDNGSVYAYDASLNLLWSRQISMAGVGSQFGGSLAFANGILYATTGQFLYAIDTTSPGRPNAWPPVQPFGGAYYGAAVAQNATTGKNVVYVGSNSNGILDTFDATTGAAGWTATLAGGIAGPPAVANGVVYVGTSSGGTEALNANTGAVLWKNSMVINTATAPAVANGIVYNHDSNGTAFAVDAATGKTVWSHSTGAGAQGSAPAISNGMVYFGAGDNLYAFGLP